MRKIIIFFVCILLMMPAIVSADRLYSSYTGYPIPESLILGFHYTGIHPTSSGEWPGNNNGLVYPFPTYAGQIFDYKYTNAGYIKFVFPYYGVPGI